MTADLSRKQLTTILSALDDAPRSPANKGEALRAIGRSAKRFGLTTKDILAAAPGLLDGRISPAEFRVELRDEDGSAPVQGTDAPRGAAEAPDGGTAGQEPQSPAKPAQAARAPGCRGSGRARRERRHAQAGQAQGQGEGGQACKAGQGCIG